MMNTGLLLRKPGESRYCRYRRFLIANRGIHKRYGSMRLSFPIYAKERFQIDTNGLRGTDAVAKVEDRIIRFLSLPKLHYLPQKSAYPRVVESCVKCSEIGFHSEVFNLEWVTVCPVHKTKLTDTCGTCKQKWPPSSAIWASDCEGCGAKITVMELARKGAFENTLDYKTIGDIALFADGSLEPIVYSINSLSGGSDGVGGGFKVCRTNISSSFTPTALLERSRSKSTDVFRVR